MTDHAPVDRSSKRRPSALKRVGVVVYNLVAVVVIIEVVLVTMLHVPRLTASAPRPLRRLVQQVYRHFNRSLIQFDPQCARYDAGLAYTLKPGTCTFQNIEYANAFQINHVGTRDEEASLEAPEVIVLGDSHAMGWGVDQDQALPQVLARMTGLKVLNAAVSSYGTPRELMMLDRLDASRMRVLIIQYTDNDLLENRTYKTNGNHLPIMSAAQYDKIVQHYASQRSYYPGKYLYRLLMKVLRLEAPEPDQTKMEPATPAEEAELFVNALVQESHTPLSGVQIVVVEINEQIRPARPFIAALDEVRRREGNPAFVRELIPLDVAPLLEPTDFYVLDDHMNARGHGVVAVAVSELLRKRSLAPPRP